MLLGVMQGRGKEKKPGALGQKVLVGYPSLAPIRPAAAPLAPHLSGGYIPAACRATQPEKYPLAAAKIKLEWKSRNKYLGEPFVCTPESDLSPLFSGRCLSPASCKPQALVLLRKQQKQCLGGKWVFCQVKL